MISKLTTITLLLLMALPLGAVSFFLLVCAVLVMAVLLIRIHRESAEERLQELNFTKLELLSRVDHDLRTQLTMIKAPLDRLRRETHDGPMAKDIEEIGYGVSILQDEIDQFLDMKSADPGSATYHPAYGDLAKFVEEVVNLYSIVTPDAGPRITVDAGDSPVMTDFDANKMRRIVNNLLNHALHNGGRKNSVHTIVRTDDRQVCITVSDDAAAPSASLSKCPGGKKHPKDSRSIGLRVVEDYTHMHGGSVRYSTSQGGNAVTVTIPIQGSFAEEQEPASGRDTFISGNIPHILNVEDNAEFRAYVTTKLSDMYDVTEARNGKEALALIEDHSFDLVLSDVHMPEMDGRELCRAIRSDIRYAQTPVILLTAAHGQDIELENLRAGADDSISKPFDIETLLARIDRVLRRAKSVTGEAPERRISRVEKELIDRIDAEIQKNLQDSEYTIESLCSALSISRSGLYKKLMQMTGKSPLEYIRMKRIQIGRDMLESGETSVSQIAWSVGFSPKQFSKYFKDEYGCLPSEYIHHLAD